MRPEGCRHLGFSHGALSNRWPISACLKSALSVMRRMRLLRVVLLCVLLLLASPQALFAGVVNETDIAPSLLAAIKDVTGMNPVFPLAEDDPFFAHTTLELNNRAITSLRGIRFFTELTRLTVEHNRLTSVRDLVFPDSIRFLSLAHNHIADVTQTSWPEGLRTLDLRNNRLTTPLDTSFPEGTNSIALDNNFLVARHVGVPRNTNVTLAGNFIFEANAIRPATLVVRDIPSVSFSPGEQRAIPFVSITSSTNPNNQVPPRLLTAQVTEEEDDTVSLTREEFRFMLEAKNAGNDYLVVSLVLPTFQQSQYDRMNQTFYRVSIPVTVWQSAENRPGAASPNNGDPAVLTALSGLSTNAVADMTRFAGGRATFSPGLLAQLASQEQNLILSHDFGYLTIDPKNLRSLAQQAEGNPFATVQITLNTFDFRPSGLTPSRFSDRQIAILSYRDFNFSVRLLAPDSEFRDMELSAPVSAVLYLLNQRFTTWDLEHLTAFKDSGTALDLLGGTYSPSTVSFSYLLNGTGRFGLGTRSTAVRWLDIAINSTQVTRWDGDTSVIVPAPIIYRGATMVPLRSIFDELGASVTWHETTNTATLSYGNKVFQLVEGRNIGTSEQAPLVINGRMLVPLRFITTEFGATVLWWSQDSRVRIVW